MSEETLPALFRHCVSVYELMDKHATNRTEGRVYEGSLTKHLADELSLSVAYYSSVMNHLKAMKCVELIRRGGGPSPSLWMLHHEPRAEDWGTADLGKGKSLTKASREQLEQRNRDLNRRLTVVEDYLRNQGAPI